MSYDGVKAAQTRLLALAEKIREVGYNDSGDIRKMYRTAEDYKNILDTHVLDSKGKEKDRWRELYDNQVRIVAAFEDLLNGSASSGTIPVEKAHTAMYA